MDSVVLDCLEDKIKVLSDTTLEETKYIEGVLGENLEDNEVKPKG